MRRSGASLLSATPSYARPPSASSRASFSAFAKAGSMPMLQSLSGAVTPSSTATTDSSSSAAQRHDRDAHGKASASDPTSPTSSTATWHLHGLSSPTDLVDLYDPTYGFKNDDPLTPASSTDAPAGFSALGSLVESKKPGLGLKELVSDLVPSRGVDGQNAAAEIEQDGEGSYFEEGEGDAESIEPVDSDFEGEEEEALDFYFPNMQDAAQSEEEEGSGSEQEEENADEDEAESGDSGGEDLLHDPRDDVEDEPGDFSKFGYPPPMAAYSETGVGQDSLSAAFSTSPKAASSNGAARRRRTRTSSNGGKQASERIEYETVPAVGGGYITRPRIFHHASYARTPEHGPDDYASSNYDATSSKMGASASASPRTENGGRRRQLSGLGVPVDGSSPPKRQERFRNWGEDDLDEQDEVDDLPHHHRPRRDPSGHSQSSQESGSLDSLPPEPVDTTSYEFRSREYRQRYGIAPQQHWEAKRMNGREAGGKGASRQQLGAALGGNSSMTMDATHHLGNLVNSHQTLSPFTPTMEGVALRSATLTSGNSGSATASSTDAFPLPPGAIATPSLLDSRLQAVEAREHIDPPSASTPQASRVLRAQQLQQQQQADSQTAVEAPKGRRRRIFKLGSAAKKEEGEANPAEARADTPSERRKVRSSTPGSAASSHPLSSVGSSPSQSRSASHSPVESRASSAQHQQKWQQRRHSSQVSYSGSSSAAKANAARWESIRE
jgi:hypothetical protein